MRLFLRCLLVLLVGVFFGGCLHRPYTLYPTPIVQSSAKDIVALGSWMIVKGKEKITIESIVIGGVMTMPTGVEGAEYMIKVRGGVQQDEVMVLIVPAKLNGQTKQLSFAETNVLDMTGDRFSLEVSLLLPYQYYGRIPSSKDFVLSHLEIREKNSAFVQVKLPNDR